MSKIRNWQARGGAFGRFFVGGITLFRTVPVGKRRCGGGIGPCSVADRRPATFGGYAYGDGQGQRGGGDTRPARG